MAATVPVLSPQQMADGLGVNLSQFALLYRGLMIAEFREAAGLVDRGFYPDMTRLRRFLRTLKTVDKAWDKEFGEAQES
jgi:hypothetical protein